MTRSWSSNLILTLLILLTACVTPRDELASAGDRGAAEATTSAVLEETSVAAEEADKTYVPPVMPDDPDPALWVISDDDTTIYLFGTIHLLKPGLTWFDEAVKTAFDSSEELVIEMIQPAPAEMVKIVNDLAIDKSGISLRDKLTPDDRAHYEQTMTDLSLPVGSFDPLDPWFASVNLSLMPLLKSGYDSNQGAEKSLVAEAEARGLKIVGLETPRQQLGFFDNLPEEVQIRFLNFTVDSIKESAEGMNAMVAHWANADVDALAEMMNAGLEDKILYETLLVNRNANWAEWVAKRMKEPGTVFLAVGAGHLAGTDSLQAFLAKKDYTAERIEY
jgi:uncharacterized protein YbaP (TraB family)